MAKLFQFRTVGQGPKLARVHKAEVVQTGPNSKVPGSRMLKLTLKITEGKYEGETLFAYAMLEGKGAFSGLNAVAAIAPSVDWRGDGFPEDETGEVDWAALPALFQETLVDEDVIAVVVHEEYEGKSSVKVKEFLPADADVTLEDDAQGEAA